MWNPYVLEDMESQCLILERFYKDFVKALEFKSECVKIKKSGGNTRKFTDTDSWSFIKIIWVNEVNQNTCREKAGNR